MRNRNGSGPVLGRRGLIGMGLATLPSPALLGASAAPADRQQDQDGLAELGIGELQRLMDAGELDARRLIRFYLWRIEQMNRHGPSLHAVIEVNSDAMRAAARLDGERRATGPRGPLHGVPVLLKDLLD